MKIILREFYIPRNGEEPKERYIIILEVDGAEFVLQPILTKDMQYSTLEDALLHVAAIDPKDKYVVQLSSANRYRAKKRYC
jgi:hypothetical protein